MVDTAPHHAKGLAPHLGRWLTNFFIVTWSLVPIAWLAVMATQPERNYLTVPPQIQISDFSLEWVRAMASNDAFARSALNSLIVSVGTTILCVTLGALAGYALSRLRLRGKGAFLGIIVVARIVPSMILVVPVFLVARALGLLDTLTLLIIVYTALYLPFATWLLKNYFDQVPGELERAARMDGCTRFSVLHRVILPLSLPGLAATASFVLIGTWNAFLFGLILTSRHATPVTLELSRQVGMGYQPDDPTISQLAAAGILTFIPVMLLVVVLSRHIISGLVPASKG